MSDTPREPERLNPAEPGDVGSSDAAVAAGAADAARGPSARGGLGAARDGLGGAGGGRGAAGRRLFGFGAAGAADERQRRRRAWFVVGLAVAAVLVLGALCAGVVSLFSSFNGVRERVAGAREARELHETDCLDLERRLNKLNPPGASSGPKERAVAVRDENAAVRLYVGQLHGNRELDAWRQLLDARTVFADALDKQASARTPAFYVAPRADDGLAVSAELEQWSPAQCAGPVRRLAAPDL